MYSRAVVDGSSRLLELLGGLSLASDVVNAFPLGKTVRTALLASDLARAIGEPEDVAGDALYLTLLRYLGCTGFAHEEAHVYGAGDDHSVRTTMVLADVADPVATVARIARGVAPAASALRRAAAIGRLLGDGVAGHAHAQAQCETSAILARQIGASARIVDALSQICERWDGKGEPARIEGEAIAIAIRVYSVADIVEVVHHREGREAAIDTARRRSGAHFEPRIAAALASEAARLFDRIESADVLEHFLAAEPAPHTMIDRARALDVARALGRFVDLKSVYTLGHAEGVASLARAIAAAMGASAETTVDVELAGHLHDLGRVSVPNAIWDHPGPLGFAERERVRLHAYYTDRILTPCRAVGRAAAVAAAAHERLDGRGYHRGVGASALAPAARILAVADAMHAMREPRPHRPTRSEAEIATSLRDGARSGALDVDVVDAALALAGGGRRAPARTGLSDRELEIVRWVARGKTNKEIGIILGISPRTVQTHVARVYAKVGVYSRAGAALYAMENALLESS